MIDFFNLTNKNPNPIYYFNSGTWIKPRGISSVFITAIGAGGGVGVVVHNPPEQTKLEEVEEVQERYLQVILMLHYYLMF